MSQQSTDSGSAGAAAGEGAKDYFSRAIPWVAVVRAISGAVDFGGGGASKRERKIFRQAGGTVEHRGTGKWRFTYQGQQISEQQAQKIARQFRKGKLPPPPAQNPNVPSSASFPPNQLPQWMLGATAADELSKARAKRKSKTRKAKVKKILSRAKWLEKYFPWLARVSRYWGPTGAVIVAQDTYRNRKKIWKDYSAWEAKQPRVDAPVIRAPGPGAIPGNTRSLPIPRTGGPTNPRGYPRPAPLDPFPMPTVPRMPVPSNRPAGVPRTSSRPRTSSSPGLDPFPMPSSQRMPVPSTRPASSPAPAPAPRTDWKKLATQAAQAFSALSPYFNSPAGDRVKFTAPTTQPNPLTSSQPLALSSLAFNPQPRPQSDKCKCAKPRKKSGKPKCSNPRTSSRTFTRNGQKYRTTTRRLQCPA